ncbi:APC family permease [Skermania piniformis]|uniref:APC family permease n=1 Tax=Skermania pinensis TaxID=39122 RepID=UPI0009F994F9|nr:APC family permease [Skermania piniformis]
MSSPAASAPDRPPVRLRAGALSLTASVVIGVASAGPAYSLTATLGLVVLAVGWQAPIVALLAFVPMLLVAIAYRELNAAEPDPGTTFVWATRAFGPLVGWLNGWAIVIADLLVMASLAQVSAQYTFLFCGADGIGSRPDDPRVLLLGLGYIVAMTWVAVRGITLSARLQAVLLTVEFVMLVVFAVVALIRVALGDGTATPELSWFNPLAIGSFSTFVDALLLMVFIYWGWDSVMSTNEETKDPRRTPGRSAIIATITLVGLYVLVTVAAQAFAGIGTDSGGLADPEHVDDILGALGSAVFGDSTIGTIAVHLLLLMVLTSAAASTQTTILPTSRTTYSMALHGALPARYGAVDPRYRTPVVSTVVFGVASILLYLVLSALSGRWGSTESPIVDAVSACGIGIGIYYGCTGLACAWLYRNRLRDSVRDFLMRGLLPTLGGAMLLFAAGWTAVTEWPSPVFLLGVGGMLAGLPIYFRLSRTMPPYFRGETLARQLPGPAEAVRE